MGCDDWTGPRRPVVVRVSGEMDMDRAQVFRADLAAAIERAASGREVVIDLTDLSFCDSSGLNVLLGARLDAQQAGHLLRLAGPSSQMTRLLEVTGVTELFPIVPVPPF